MIVLPHLGFLRCPRSLGHHLHPAQLRPTWPGLPSAFRVLQQIASHPGPGLLTVHNLNGQPWIFQSFGRRFERIYCIAWPCQYGWCAFQAWPRCTAPRQSQRRRKMLSRETSLGTLTLTASCLKAACCVAEAKHALSALISRQHLA